MAPSRSHTHLSKTKTPTRCFMLVAQLLPTKQSNGNPVLHPRINTAMFFTCPSFGDVESFWWWPYYYQSLYSSSSWSCRLCYSDNYQVMGEHRNRTGHRIHICRYISMWRNMSDVFHWPGLVALSATWNLMRNCSIISQEYTHTVLLQSICTTVALRRRKHMRPESFIRHSSGGKKRCFIKKSDFTHSVHNAPL